MRILIAYDGSECAEAAMVGLARAGLPEACDVTVLSVADVWLPPERREDSTRANMLPGLDVLRAQGKLAVEAARELAAQAAQKLRSVFPQWQVAAEACADSPAWSIIKHTEQLRPDLVVVGSHGRSGLGRLVLGSVSMRVLTELRCSVRIGRAGPSEGPIKVIVGAEGSDDANAAIRAVCDRRWPVGTEVRVVTAANWRLHTAPITPPLAWNTPYELWAECVAQRARGQLSECGIAASAVVELGDAKHVLVEAARNWHADCIFVGARGLTRAERMLIGSVSSAVAMRAPCSVEVVHPVRTG